MHCLCVIVYLPLLTGSVRQSACRHVWSPQLANSPSTTTCTGDYNDIMGDCRMPNQCNSGSCSTAVFETVGTSCSSSIEFQVTVPVGGDVDCYETTVGTCGENGVCVVSLWLLIWCRVGLFVQKTVHDVRWWMALHASRILHTSH